MSSLSGIKKYIEDIFKSKRLLSFIFFVLGKSGETIIDKIQLT